MKKILLIVVTVIIISGIGISFSGKYFADGNTGLPTQHTITSNYDTTSVL